MKTLEFSCAVAPRSKYFFHISTVTIEMRGLVLWYYILERRKILLIDWFKVSSNQNMRTYLATEQNLLGREGEVKKGIRIPTYSINREFPCIA